MKTLLIVGADSASSWILDEVQKKRVSDLSVYIDKSSGIERILKLLWKRRIPLSAFVRIVAAELSREKSAVQSFPSIKNNLDILSAVQKNDVDRILCFRCGVIINSEVLSLGIPVYNLHVSDLPRYPGLGTIWQSICDKSWEQNACLHFIDTGIDTGTVIEKMSYKMSPANSYKANEDIAYKAGVRLALKFLTEEAE